MYLPEQQELAATCVSRYCSRHHGIVDACTYLMLSMTLLRSTTELNVLATCVQAART
jgi:hypothetical protein